MAEPEKRIESERELLELALLIERQGVETYRTVAESADNFQVQHFFLRLLDMEVKHVHRRLEAMIHEKFGRQPESAVAEPRRSWGSELQIFPDNFELDLETSKMQDPREALELARRLEKRAVLLYERLSETRLSDEAMATVRLFIDEEKLHLTRIDDFGRDLGL